MISPHDLIRAGIAQLAGQDPERAVVVEASGVEGGLETCDLVVVDLSVLQDTAYRGLVQRLVERVRVLGLARANEPRLVHGAALLGLTDTVPDSITGPELLSAIESLVARPRVVLAPAPRPSTGPRGPVDRGPDHGAPLASLTGRELDVLLLIAAGLSNEQIGRQLYVSINSVKTYVRNAYRHIGVSRRSQAVAWAAHHGLVATSRPRPPRPGSGSAR